MWGAQLPGLLFYVNMERGTPERVSVFLIHFFLLLENLLRRLDRREGWVSRFTGQVGIDWGSLFLNWPTANQIGLPNGTRRHQMICLNLTSFEWLGIFQIEVVHARIHFRIPKVSDRISGAGSSLAVDTKPRQQRGGSSIPTFDFDV